MIDADSRAVLFEIGSKEAPLTAAAFSPDDLKIVSGSREGVARVWNGGSGSLLRETKPQTGPVSQVVYGPDSLRLATVSGNTAQLFDAESGDLISVLRGHGQPIWKIDFEPSGKRVLTASADGTARLWDADTGAEICRTNAHTAFVVNAAFSSNGKRFVTSSWDSTARVWDAQNCGPVSVLGPHLGAVREAAFSPDGRIVATASGDPSNLTNPSRNAVILWDAESGVNIAELRGHTRPIWSVSFSSDGNLLITASEDQTVRVWDVSLVTGWSGPELLEKVCQDKLIGAQIFLAEELRQPVLAGTRDVNPCERNGPLTLQYWIDAVINLFWR